MICECRAGAVRLRSVEGADGEINLDLLAEDEYVPDLDQYGFEEPSYEAMEYADSGSDEYAGYDPVNYIDDDASTSGSGSFAGGQDCENTCSCNYVGTGTDVNVQYLCQQDDVCYNLVSSWCAEEEEICEVP